MCKSIRINQHRLQECRLLPLCGLKFIREILPLNYPLKVIPGSFAVKIMENLTKIRRQTYKHKSLSQPLV